jgi:hypothetical protein
MPQRLLAQFGSCAAVESQVTKRVCCLAVMPAMHSAPAMLLDEDPRRWEHTEGTLEAVARTFADEIAISGTPSTASADRYKARWMGKS